MTGSVLSPPFCSPSFTALLPSRLRLRQLRRSLASPNLAVQSASLHLVVPFPLTCILMFRLLSRPLAYFAPSFLFLSFRLVFRHLPLNVASSFAVPRVGCLFGSWVTFGSPPPFLAPVWNHSRFPVSLSASQPLFPRVRPLLRELLVLSPVSVVRVRLAWLFFAGARFCLFLYADDRYARCPPELFLCLFLLPLSRPHSRSNPRLRRPALWPCNPRTCRAVLLCASFSSSRFSFPTPLRLLPSPLLPLLVPSAAILVRLLCAVFLPGRSPSVQSPTVSSCPPLSRFPVESLPVAFLPSVPSCLQPLYTAAYLQGASAVCLLRLCVFSLALSRRGAVALLLFFRSGCFFCHCSLRCAIVSPVIVTRYLFPRVLIRWAAEPTAVLFRWPPLSPPLLVHSSRLGGPSRFSVRVLAPPG